MSSADSPPAGTLRRVRLRVGLRLSQVEDSARACCARRSRR